MLFSLVGIWTRSVSVSLLQKQLEPESWLFAQPPWQFIYPHSGSRGNGRQQQKKRKKTTQWVERVIFQSSLTICRAQRYCIATLSRVGEAISAANIKSFQSIYYYHCCSFIFKPFTQNKVECQERQHVSQCRLERVKVTLKVTLKSLVWQRTNYIGVCLVKDGWFNGFRASNCFLNGGFFLFFFTLGAFVLFL